MKRIIALVLLLGMLVCVLTACGNEKFQCGLCMKEVEGKKHTTDVYGQKLDICDDCYKQLQEMADALNNQ